MKNKITSVYPWHGGCMKVIEINDNNFEEEVIKSEKNQLVIVDFWADWCMPCRMLSPIMERVANEYDGKVKVTKINVEKNPLHSTKYGISGIPTVKMFKKGKVIDEFVGFVPEKMVFDWVKKNLGQ